MRESTANLFLVATPIGNLTDITLGALDIFKAVDLILCEDSRRAAKIFQTYKIKTARDVFHDFNKETKTPRIIKLLKSGKSVALISDAGTPGISDPGYYLVKEAIAQGIKVASIPGPSALIAALVISGLPTDRFVFEGFLPKKQGRRTKRLQFLNNEERTIIIYESPHRLKRVLEEVLKYLGDRDVCLVREITKIHEDVRRGLLSQLLAEIQKAELPLKGEFVIIIKGRK